MYITCISKVCKHRQRWQLWSFESSLVGWSPGFHPTKTLLRFLFQFSLSFIYTEKFSMLKDPVFTFKPAQKLTTIWVLNQTKTNTSVNFDFKKVMGIGEEWSPLTLTGLEYFCINGKSFDCTPPSVSYYMLSPILSEGNLIIVQNKFFPIWIPMLWVMAITWLQIF